ncbi:MAG: S53 family peptidase [Streptosporangiaceae bacterium]
MHRPIGLAAAAAVGAGALVLPFFATAAQASPSHRVTLHGTRPPWAVSSRQVATAQSGRAVAFRVQLPLRHANQAERLARAVSDPSSAQHGHYLTPKQFNKRFAPAPGTVRRVQRFLRSHGMSVTGVPKNRRWVGATGTVAEVSKAFDTTLRSYRYKGHTLRAPATQLSVPKSVAPDILTVTGVDQSGQLRRPRHIRPRHMKAAVPDNAKPKLPPPSKCSEYWDQHEQKVPPAYGGKDSFPTYICGYIPDQLQTAYGTKSAIAQGRDGSGVTVAVIDAYASPTIKSDANTYFKKVGVPAFEPGQFRQITFGPFNMKEECGATGWWTEETLDIEAVHGMAPGANVVYLGAKNCDKGIDAALNYVVQHHTANIVSNSYGWIGEDIPASEIRAEHQIFVQAAAEGIGMYFSSGDYGDNLEAGLTDSAQPDYSASDPFVTAVGGTSLGVGGGGGYKFETGWGSDLDPVAFKKNGKENGYAEPLPGHFRYGAGGGTSTLFDQPAYQSGIVPSNLARKYGDGPMRVVPDVAMDADPYTGMLVGMTDPKSGKFGTSAIGGTSLACPLFAGVQALASQGRAVPIGFANPTLYAFAGSDAYRDVAATRTATGVTNPIGTYLVTLDRDSSLQTTFGYDDVTGAGTPNGTAFLSAEGGAQVSPGRGGGHGGGGGHGHRHGPVTR